MMRAKGAILRIPPEARTDESAFTRITRVVRAALWPFDPVSVIAMIEPTHDLLQDDATLIIEVGALRAYPFKFKYSARQIGQAYDPEDFMVQSVSEPLFNHIRYRPSLPVEDHIILGED